MTPVFTYRSGTLRYREQPITAEMAKAMLILLNDLADDSLACGDGATLMLADGMATELTAACKAAGRARNNDAAPLRLVSMRPAP